jgi:hypothetical protein
MKHLALLAAALALAGCGKSSDPSSSSSSTSPSSTSAPARLSQPPRRPPKTPNFSLLVNGYAACDVVAGWPVVVRVELSSPDGKPWRVSGGDGPWSRLVRLEMPGGAAWPLEPVFAGPNEAAVDGNVSAILVWTLSPQASKALAPGPRTLRAVLEAPGGAEGAWKGTLTTHQSELKVVEAPTRRLTVEQLERKTEIDVEYAFWREGPERALACANAALEFRLGAGLWRLLAQRGYVLVALDRPAEALRSFDEALRAWAKEHPHGCPPEGLMSQRSRLLRAMVEKK